MDAVRHLVASVLKAAGGDNFPTWIAILLAFIAEPACSHATTFRKMGLRTATDLIDAAKEKLERETIVAADQAVQGKGVEDPTLLAQLAALRAQSKVKEA